VSEKLPYSFDLHFDIKTVDELHSILLNDALDSCFNQSELEEMMDTCEIPFPKGYTRVHKPDFPRIVWIDKTGGYLTYQPTSEEAHKYQRMRTF
jgi:hypothetical protein